MATIISFLEMLGQLELISQLMGKYESPFLSIAGGQVYIYNAKKYDCSHSSYIQYWRL